MYYESKEALAAFFWEHPDLKDLYLDNCPGITSLPALPSSLINLWVDNRPGITRDGAVRVGNVIIVIR